MDNKICNKCNVEKSFSEFRKHRNVCIECLKFQAKERHNNNIANGITKKKKKKTQKVCKICTTSKTIDNFEGKSRSCIQCKDKNINKCSTCKLIKNITEFRTMRCICRTCDNIKDKEKYYENHERHIERVKVYRANNKEKVKLFQRNYRNKHSKEIKYRLLGSLRVRLNQLIRKKIKTFKYIDCDISFLLKWLEYNFDEKMNWDNYATYWHIDHVTPCNKFNLENHEECLKCFNWKNLYPLEASKNISKRDKIIDEYINMVANKTEIFIKSLEIHNTTS